MPKLDDTNVVGWALAMIGTICGIAAAYVHGGLFEALTVASGACMSLAGISGWASRPPAPPPAG